MIPFRFRGSKWLGKERVRLAFEISEVETSKSKALVALPPYHRLFKLQDRLRAVEKELAWREKNKPGFFNQIFASRKRPAKKTG